MFCFIFDCLVDKVDGVDVFDFVVGVEVIVWVLYGDVDVGVYGILVYVVVVGV